MSDPSLSVSITDIHDLECLGPNTLLLTLPKRRSFLVDADDSTLFGAELVILCHECWQALRDFDFRVLPFDVSKERKLRGHATWFR